ncbi:hypothetical protein, partial [Psychromonas sp.]|uniref:hypothetical protein n=1 Tax=Psychromonas sp. TaxID=1884585 RepID=UPI003A97A38F
MAEQNSPENINNASEVELTEEKLVQTEEQLNSTGEPLDVSELLLPELDGNEILQAEVENTNTLESNQQTEIDINDLEAILALGEEVLDLDIETAAGEESDGGFTLVDFDRDGEETIATTDFETAGFDDDIESTIYTDENSNAETINTPPTLTITNTNDFTEDDGSAVEGAVVSTFDTADDDGDEVTIILSDTVNYEIVDNTVVLTEAGAALVNSGEELPAYALTPSDGLTDGDPVSVAPNVITVNDAPSLIITNLNDFTEDDGSAVEGAVVSTFETSDEEGDEVSVTLSDTVNYEIVDGTVVLTEAGADLVNSGQELPAFTLIPNDGTVDGDAVSVDPSVTTVNDAPEITILTSNDFTEDDGSAVAGAEVATFETFDEDGDEVTVTLSDTVNYALVDGSVVLTQAGADLVNSGQELPAFTLIPNDGTVDG